MGEELEIWKPVVGYEGRYEVSNFGRIKALKKEHFFGFKNAAKRIFDERILIPSYNTSGYLSVCLIDKNTNQVAVIIHQIVAKHFVDNRDNKPQVNHKNGIKTDNTAVNLEWVTCKENIRHAHKNGLAFVKRGGNHHWSKLVLNTQNGIFYDSIGEAANSVCMKLHTLAQKLRGRRKNDTYFVYV